MNQKLLFIYNMHAGKGQIKYRIAELADIFIKNQYEVTVYSTQDNLDGLRKVKEDGAGYDLIICCGGDGTLNEIVRGVIALDKNIPIGYIPTGSTNDFSATLKIPKNPAQAAAIAVGKRIQGIDIGTLNGRHFVYVAAFGLFTDVAYQTSQEMKNVLGHSAYLIEGMKRLSNIPIYNVTVEYEDKKLQGEYIYGMVTNSRSVGGFKNITGKNVTLDDGIYEVTLIRKIQNPLQFKEVLEGMIKGNLGKAECVDIFKASRIVFTCEQAIPWTVDGENGGEHQRTEIINHRQAVRIHVPE